MSDSRRAPLVLLSAGVFLAVSTEMLPVGLLPEIGQGLDVSPAQTGLLVSLFAVLVALTTVPIAAVVQRWPRRAVLAGLLGAYTVSNVVFALAPGYGVALLARAIGGLAHAGFFAVAVATAVSLVDAERAGRAVALLGAGNALALVFGVPLGTALGPAVGWRWAFVVLAVALVVLAVAVLRVLPAQTPESEGTRTSVLDGIRRPAVLVMAVVIALLALGPLHALHLRQPAAAARRRRAPPHRRRAVRVRVGGVLGLAAAGAVVVRRPGPALAATLVLMLVSLVLAAVVSSSPGIIAVVVLWGVAFGAFPTLTQTVMLHAAEGATDAASSLVNATTNVGIAGERSSARSCSGSSRCRTSAGWAPGWSPSGSSSTRHGSGDPPPEPFLSVVAAPTA